MITELNPAIICGMENITAPDIKPWTKPDPGAYWTKNDREAYDRYIQETFYKNVDPNRHLMTKPEREALDKPRYARQTTGVRPDNPSYRQLAVDPINAIDRFEIPDYPKKRIVHHGPVRIFLGNSVLTFILIIAVIFLAAMTVMAFFTPPFVWGMIPMLWTWQAANMIGEIWTTQPIRPRA